MKSLTSTGIPSLAMLFCNAVSSSVPNNVPLLCPFCTKVVSWKEVSEKKAPSFGQMNINEHWVSTKHMEMFDDVPSWKLTVKGGMQAVPVEMEAHRNHAEPGFPAKFPLKLPIFWAAAGCSWEISRQEHPNPTALSRTSAVRRLRSGFRNFRIKKTHGKFNDLTTRSVTPKWCLALRGES